MYVAYKFVDICFVFSVCTVANNLEEKTLDELDELEDEEDERVLEEYRRKRIAEMKELASKSKYGEMREITAEDYVQEVNNAGEDVWVILHLYKTGYATLRCKIHFIFNTKTLIKALIEHVFSEFHCVL